MSTKNPFGILNVNRDDSDDDGMVKVTPTTVKSASNFVNTQEQKKKKKVRPEENKQREVTTTYTSGVQEITEGFEVVGKVAKRPYTAKNNVEEVEGEGKKENKKPYKGTGNNDRVYNATRPQKRQYEKHSGTGRGREIAKEGAGGKGTWGDNYKQIARQGKQYGTRDDYCKNKFNIKF